MKRFIIVSVAIIAATLLTGPYANTSVPASSTETTSSESGLARLHIPFIKNVGQVDADVAFYADTFGGAVVVKKQGELELIVPHRGDDNNGYSIINESFVGAQVKHIEGSAAAVTKVSYFLGNQPDRWRSNIPTYETVSMGDIYNDIGLKLKAYGNNVEKLFHVRPGADPASIQIKVKGTRSISVTDEGLLELNLTDCVVMYSRPKAYQVIENEMRPVEVAYRVSGDSYGFELGDYDTSKELVIDPLLQSTYFGGTGNDVIREIGIAPDQKVYVIGSTDSEISSFSLTPDGTDAFVALFSPKLAQLQNVTFIGGTDSGKDHALAIAFRSTTIDEFEVYIAGETASADLPGLATGGADSEFGTALTGETEGFIARFSSDLILLGTSYYGGSTVGDSTASSSPDDSINSIAISNNGIYIAGTTSCDDIPQISTGSSSQDAYGMGSSDGFIAKLVSDLTSITAATYLGGLTEDQARDLFVDTVDNIDTTVYIAGNTDSADFPGIAASPSAIDAFVSKIDASLTGAITSTYIGGSGNEDVQALVNTAPAADSLLYLAGTTTSADFPPGDGAPTFPDPEDNFIARINKDLSTEYQATYLGGNKPDKLWDMALHKEGSAFDISTDSVYVTGSTSSYPFPGHVQGEQEDLVGTEDAFVMRIDAALTNSATYQMTYLGGTESETGREFGYAIAVDAVNGVYVGGLTTADDFPGTATVYSGNNDGFVTRHGLTLQYVTEIRVSPTLPIDFG
ncbi:MAG: hypothetical protein KJP10_04270, partial [Gammaproteobacteria bacterium]|nr:hypothetical protein [Gammaproteobacteria bacterium]